jgi:type IV pilus assembly protein PilY1
MRIHRQFLLSLAILTVSVLATPDTSLSQVNADYAAVPPFLASDVTPNVLILMDNSGSMGYRAACDDSTNQSAPLFNLCPGGGAFSESTTYTGLFDSLACYTYDAGNTRFVQSGAAKALISTACGSTLWDGNLLNWITFRRQDALKKALMGGQCAVSRASDGTCPPSGSQPLITIKTEDEFNSTCCANVATAPITTAACGAACANGRVPTAVQTLGTSPAKLVFHARGTGTLSGSFCVANPADGLPTSSSSCTMTGGSGFTEQRFVSHLAVPTEPLGVIQQLGDKARFGLRIPGTGGRSWSRSARRSP